MRDRPKRFRLLRLAFGYGALAGLALGLAIIAPRLLAAHRLIPSSFGAWAAIIGFLSLLFATLGGLLGLYAGLPAVIISRRDPDPGDALPARVADACVALVPVGYLGLALILEKVAFGTVISGAAVARASAAWLAAVGASWVLAWGFARERSVRHPARWLVAATAVAAVLLPLRLGRPPMPAPIAPLEGGAAAPPLLFIGIDGASWAVLDPLLAAGRLPVLGELVRKGATGDVVNPDPPHWSAPAWATIATGVAREQHGVHEDLAATAPWVGSFEVPLVPDPLLEPTLAGEQLLQRLGVIDLHYHERSALRATPFWERVSRAGRPAAVIGFPFTHPAEDRADLVVSNWLGEDLWSLSDLRRDDGSRGVFPPAHAARLLEPFLDQAPAGLAPWLRVLLPDRPGKTTTDKLVDPVHALEIATAIDFRTFAAAERALAIRRDAGLLAVYLRGLDGVSHAFWSYRFPESFTGAAPPPAERAALHGVLDRYWEFLDDGLARLIRAFPEPPNVVIVADHGFEPVDGHGLWSGWHAGRDGVFLAAGPSVSARSRRSIVALADVAPTALALLGFVPPPDLAGRRLLVDVAAPSVAAGGCGCDKGVGFGTEPCSASAENC